MGTRANDETQAKCKFATNANTSAGLVNRRNSTRKQTSVGEVRRSRVFCHPALAAAFKKLDRPDEAYLCAWTLDQADIQAEKGTSSARNLPWPKIDQHSEAADDLDVQGELDDDRWSRLARIRRSTCNGPNPATLHCSFQADTASTNAWSRMACALLPPPATRGVPPTSRTTMVATTKRGRDSVPRADERAQAPDSDYLRIKLGMRAGARRAEATSAPSSRRFSLPSTGRSDPRATWGD